MARSTYPAPVDDVPAERARTRKYKDFMEGNLRGKRSTGIVGEAMREKMFAGNDPYGSQLVPQVGQPVGPAEAGNFDTLAGGVISPVQGVTEFTNTFGADRSGGRQHQGTDIFAPEGTMVFAPLGGTVTRGAYDNKLGGTSFGFEDDYGNYHYFTHLSEAFNIEPGTKIGAGTAIGRVGKTGNAANTPHHLHYSINEGRSNNINSYWFLTGQWTPW